MNLIGGNVGVDRSGRIVELCKLGPQLPARADTAGTDAEAEQHAGLASILVGADPWADLYEVVTWRCYETRG